MSSPEERIRGLVRTRGLDQADAEGLLAAVRSPSPKSRNPFEHWSGEVTSVAGALVAGAALATSRLGVRYDGALDLHVVPAAVPLKTALLDQSVAFPLSALVFWGVAKLLSRGVRLVDVVGVVGVARLPLVLLAAPLTWLTPHIPKEPGKPSAALFAVLGLALVGIGAHITLLVLGFRATTAARGGRLAGAFVGALVAAEVATKLVLVLVT